jgi:hypothetical protein
VSSRFQLRRNWGLPGNQRRQTLKIEERKAPAAGQIGGVAK